jgi:hypothetical protein
MPSSLDAHERNLAIGFWYQIVEKFMSNRLFNELSSQGNFLAKVVHAMFDNPSLQSIMLMARS